MVEVDLAPVHGLAETYKLGWVSGFYGCSLGLLSTRIFKAESRYLFENGYDAGLIAREQQHNGDLQRLCL